MKLTGKSTGILSAVVLASVSLGLIVSAQAQVFTWKDSKGVTHYADVPQGMRVDYARTLNVRTQAVNATAASTGASQPGVAAASGSLAEQQAALNQRLAEQNKQIEEQNKKIAEQNAKDKADNCKVAQMNLNTAKNARADQREQLVKNYEGQVAKYCN